MKAATSPPWLYLEIAAAILTVGAWIAVALWLKYLPVLRSVAVTGTIVCLSAAASGIVPFLGAKASPALAVLHLVTAAAFLGFAVALGRGFKLAAARRRTEVAAPPGEAP